MAHNKIYTEKLDKNTVQFYTMVKGIKVLLIKFKVNSAEDQAKGYKIAQEQFFDLVPVLSLI